jgi:predicted Zn-dependent peptidase
LERCLELFSDILFHSTFPQHEIEKEKDVVIEEINLYKDSPAELIYDDFEEMIFGRHPLAHNILGSKKNVKHFSSEQLSRFLHQNYTPDKMVISVVGNVEFKRLVHLCEKYFSHTDGQPNVKTDADDKVEYQRFNNTLNKRTHQVHLLAGCPAPTIYDEKKNAFTLLNNILGGPAMNSRLNVSVRENQGFCYTIESQYVPFTDAGLFYIYAGVDSDAAERSTQLILEELRRLREVKLSPQQLHSAQTQLIGQMAITNDSGLNEMQSIGKAYLNFDHVDTLEEMNRDIMNVTPKELQAVAQEIFAEDKFSFLYYK